MDELIRKVRSTLKRPAGHKGAGKQAKICVVGTGYVGLPLVVEFARKGFAVTGFDPNEEKISKLSKGVDVIGEFGDGFLEEVIKECNVTFTSDPKAIGESDFILICVPTPVNKDSKPDLSHVESAGRTVAENMSKGSVVVLESTVYPGVTEDVLKPVLEEVSGLKAGEGFGLGYSPERVNPGDKEHSLRTVVKIVSGSDKASGDAIEELYKTIVEAGVFRTSDIRTAEAAKVIENIQRDLNISLVNELSKIFRKMGIDTKEVLDAARTKWNFHDYSPGLVGGHCIPVDPYYLVHKSRELGYEPRVILAGRDTNNDMSEFVADMVLEELKKVGKEPSGSSVLLLGLTFKKNVSDTRNSPVDGIIRKLKGAGIRVAAYEPLLGKDSALREFGVENRESLEGLSGIDAIITITDHDVFTIRASLEKLRKVSSDKPVLVDVRRMYDPKLASEAGFIYQGL